MSCVTAVLTGENVHFATDTAVSCQYDGKYYRIGEDGFKRHTIGDRTIFTTGMTEAINKFVEEANKAKELTIPQMVSLAKKTSEWYNDLFYKKNGYKNSLGAISFLTADVTDERCMLHIIDSIYQNWYHGLWASKKSVGHTVVTIGVTDKVTDKILKGLQRDNYYLPAIIQNAFDESSFEAVGGCLYIYRQSKIGLEEIYKNKINEPSQMNRMVVKNDGTATAIATSHLNANLVTIKSTLVNGGFVQIDGSGIHANNGTIDTFVVDLDGNATFAGNVTSDAVITGATFRTADVGHDRIEISGGSLRGITADGNDTGIRFDISKYQSQGTADIEFLHNGRLLMIFKDNYDGYTIKPASDALYLEIGDKSVSKVPTHAVGTWSFDDGFSLTDSNGNVKAQLYIENKDDPTSSTIFEMGVGTGTGDNGKVKITKTSTSVDITYTDSSGNVKTFTANDNGIGLNHSVGSYIQLDNSGNMNFHCPNNMNFSHGGTLNLDA